MRVAVLGLGIIGGAWARNLHADQVELRTWNRTPKPDMPGFVADPARAVEGCEAVIVVVADPPAVQQVLDGIAPALGERTVLIQSSTVSAKWTLRFADEVRARGAAFLEAPFTGSKLAAERRETVFYTGGEAATLERARPVLARLSKAILPVGALGSASSLKLALNVNIALVGQALCESLALARAAGIADDAFFAALKFNASRSGLAELKEPKLRGGDYAPQFSLKHMLKDLRLALETAGDLPLAQARQVVTAYERGAAEGWSEEDFTCLYRLVERSGKP